MLPLHNGETEYLGIMTQILMNGKNKSNRTGTDTRAIPPIFWKHDMSQGFPLLTTKRLAKKMIMEELEGFIGGITSKKWYQDHKCSIWNEWCNPDVAKYNTPEAILADDLGPVYGYQWRRFNKPYISGQPNTKKFAPGTRLEGDQLAELLYTLKTNPGDRRMKVEAWNFLQTDQQALPACHCGFTVTVIDGKLNLHFEMRSVDMFLGAPFNIASYGMMLILLCAECGFEPGQLSAAFIDCHIYVNHIPQVKEQLSRKPFDLPTLKLDNWDGFWNWEASDVQWINLQCHPAIKGVVAV